MQLRLDNSFQILNYRRLQRSLWTLPASSIHYRLDELTEGRNNHTMIHCYYKLLNAGQVGKVETAKVSL